MTGGASYVFTRIYRLPTARKKGDHGIYFKKRLLRRQDAVSYDHDAFGKVIDGYPEEHAKRNISEFLQSAEAGDNEVILKHGISVLDNIDVIVVRNKEEKEALVKVFEKHGVTELPDGRSVRRAIKTRK